MTSPVKKIPMTDTERMKTLLRHEKPDRIPVWPLGYPGFAVVNAGYTIADAYSKPDKALDAQQWCCEQYGWIFTPLLFYGGWCSMEFGGEVNLPKGNFEQVPQVIRYPVESEDDVLAMKVPNVKTAGIIPLVMEFNQLAIERRSEENPFSVLVPVGGPFSLAGNIAGAEKLLKWVLKKPNLAHRLVRLANEHSIELFRLWKDTFGTDDLLPFIGEPTASNQMISSKQFEQFVFPYLNDLHEQILAMGFKHIYCHICGDANANLPFWAQIPMGDPGIVSVGHEVDILTAAEYFPNDIIMGNLEPTIIQTGTPQHVLEASLEIIKKGKQCPGGFVLSPGCELPPMAPPLNVWMMTKAAIEAGWYI